ncbi:MAG TPA: hypothetical protein VER36_08900 [Flavisolibacter sp.]|nr:hypothetical protein [Flavisolibacter sp.]
MNAEEYKSLINRKDVLDYSTLNITLKELVSTQEFELAGNLKRIIENNKIAKPDLHSKPHNTSTTHYTVGLSSDDIEKIIDLFFDLEASHLDENGETTPTASFYASFVDRWNELTYCFEYLKKAQNTGLPK